MILNFYKWLLAELEKEGYTESDIVLFQNAMTDKLYPMDVVKQHLNKDISVSSEKRDLIIVTGAMMIHLSDGTIVEYCNEQDDYDLQEYTNTLTYYFSVQRLLAKETANEEKEPVIGLVLDEGYKSFSGNKWFHDDFLLNHWSKTGLIVVDVQLKENVEKQDFYALVNKKGSLITLDVETRKLYINVLQLEDMDIDDIIKYLLGLPMIVDNQLVDAIAKYKPEEPNTLKYKGLVDFFSQHADEIQNSKLTGS